jgi:hypothetical protein
MGIFMTEKEIMFHIDLTFEELYSIMFAENNNIDELLISFQFTEENLKALCQKCHLAYDKEHHIKIIREKKNESKRID